MENTYLDHIYIFYPRYYSFHVHYSPPLSLDILVLHTTTLAIHLVHHKHMIRLDIFRDLSILEYSQDLKDHKKCSLKIQLLCTYFFRL